MQDCGTRPEARQGEDNSKVTPGRQQIRRALGFRRSGQLSAFLEGPILWARPCTRRTILRVLLPCPGRWCRSCGCRASRPSTALASSLGTTYRFRLIGSSKDTGRWSTARPPRYYIGRPRPSRTHMCSARKQPPLFWEGSIIQRRRNGMNEGARGSDRLAAKRMLFYLLTLVCWFSSSLYEAAWNEYLGVTSLQAAFLQNEASGNIFSPFCGMLPLIGWVGI